MRIRVLLPLLSGVVIGIAVGLMQSQGANAACGFINGVWSHELAMTPGCVAENNATAAADNSGNTNSNDGGGTSGGDGGDGGAGAGTGNAMAKGGLVAKRTKKPTPARKKGIASKR